MLFSLLRLIILLFNRHTVVAFSSIIPSADNKSHYFIKNIKNNLFGTSRFYTNKKDNINNPMKNLIMSVTETNSLHASTVPVNLASIFPFGNDDGDDCFETEQHSNKSDIGKVQNSRTGERSSVTTRSKEQKVNNRNEDQHQQQHDDDHNDNHHHNNHNNIKPWQDALDKFKEQVLDESYYSGLPIPLTMIEAASMYESTTNNNYLMPGSHKHLGGAYDPTDGCIYGVPANSRSVLCLYPVRNNDNINDNNKVKIEDEIIENDKKQTDFTNCIHEKKNEVYEYRITTIPLPESCYKYQYKWLRGIFAHGYLWAIPAWADCVLCVDVDQYWGRRQGQNSNEQQPQQPIVQLIPLPPNHIQRTWQWHGAGINHNKTAIYCIPSNAEHVLKVDLLTKTTSFIAITGYDPIEYPQFDVNMTNKWYGGIVGVDNCVYGIPYRSCSILQINCNTDTATIIGSDYGINKYFWHGGIQVNGKIYAHPSHANTVLVIDTSTTQSIPHIYEIPIQRASYDHDTVRTYKWLGGSIGIDGNIYCPACDSSAVLKINVSTQTCTTFGYAGSIKNKWQGGLLGRDGCVYCIPASGRHVLRIATTAQPDSNSDQHQPLFRNECDRVQLIGTLPAHKDKWQGGYQGLDGSLYFIPENGYRVMKVTPPKALVLTSIGTFQQNDCTIEML